MSWTTPRTWTAEVMSSSVLNTHLRDNLVALKDPPTDDFTTTGNYTTTSTTFVDVNATDWSLDITPAGTEVWIFARLNVIHSAANDGVFIFDITKDGASVSGETNGIVLFFNPNNARYTCCSFIYRLTGLTAGVAINLKLQWRTGTGTATLEGTSADSWWAVREMS